MIFLLAILLFSSVFHANAMKTYNVSVIENEISAQLSWDEQETNPNIQFNVSCTLSDGWCGFGWNTNAFMPGTEAVICQNGEVFFVRATSYVAQPLQGYVQNLQCSLSSSGMTMEFSRKFEEPESNVNFKNSAYFIGAGKRGVSNFEKHLFTGHASVSLPAPTPSPTLSPTSTDAPTLNPTNSPTFAPSFAPTRDPNAKENVLSIDTIYPVNSQARWYDEDNPMVRFTVVCSTPNWCAFAMNGNSASMTGMEAVICSDQIVTLNQAEGHYSLNNFGVKQYLQDVSCEQNATTTVMRFSRRFTLSSEEANTYSVNFSTTTGLFFLSAIGNTGSISSGHSFKGYTFRVMKAPVITSSPTVYVPSKENVLSINTINAVKAEAKWESSSNPLVRFTVVCSSPNWCALGMNLKSASMSGMEAAICVNQIVRLYQAESHYSLSDTGVKQYLNETSCFQNSTTTVMKFSRRFYISSEISNSNTVNFSSTSTAYFLTAYGMEKTLSSGHSERAFTAVKFPEKIDGPLSLSPSRTPTLSPSTSPTSNSTTANITSRSDPSKVEFAIIASVVVGVICLAVTAFWIVKKRSTKNNFQTRLTLNAEQVRISSTGMDVRPSIAL